MVTTDPSPSPSPTAPGPSRYGPAPEDLAAVTDVLTTRAGALTTGDDGAYFGTVSRADPAAEDRQVSTFMAAEALGIARLAVDDVRLEADPSALPGEAALLATARWSYRIGDLDRADRVASVSVRVVRVEGRWLVVSERPAGPGATAPWLALPGTGGAHLGARRRRRNRRRSSARRVRRRGGAGRPGPAARLVEDTLDGPRPRAGDGRGGRPPPRS